MRLLLLTDDASPAARGGAGRIVLMLRGALARRGHEVTLLTTHQEKESAEKIWKDGDGRIISLYRQYPLRERHRRCLGDPAFSALLERHIRALRPDAVNAHNIHTYMSYDSLGIARLCTDRVFLTAHDTFLVSFHRVHQDGYLRAALENKGYTMRWREHLHDAGRRYWPFRNRSIRSALRNVRTIIAISKALESFLHANGIGNTTVIPNGIEETSPPLPADIRQFRERHALSGPVVFFAGRISEEKGIRVLLTAMEQVIATLPKAVLLIAGDRQRLESHLSIASGRLRAAIRTTGWIDQDAMRVAHAASTLFVTPSLYLDNFPTVNLDAMAAGKPVVGTIFGGTPEAVEDGETGFIVDPRNTAALANALLRLLRDPALAQKMGKAGEERVHDAFTIERQAECYLRLFNTP